MSETWDQNHSFGQLANAVNINDKKTVCELIQCLVVFVHRHPNIYDPQIAGNILNVLRRRRLFEEMRQVADAFLNNGCLSFMIRKYYAQSLVDLGFLAAAEDVLIHLRSDTHEVRCNLSEELDKRNDAEKQWAEACGLLGRIYKDRYVNADAPEVERNQLALNSAIKHYYDCYTSNKNLMKKRHWHGMNAIALARLGKKQGVSVTVPFDVIGTAETILEEINMSQAVNDDDFDIWATANAMEASIALKNWEEAYVWAKKYADPTANRAKYADAFEVAGTLRQLEEVWKLNINEEPGSLLIPLMRTRLQGLDGFNFYVDANEPKDLGFLKKQADSLELKFGGDFLTFRVYFDGINRARGVARIGPSAEEHFGTGFLIDGGELDPRLTGKHLLVTCDHVVSNTDFRALPPNRANITFRAEKIQEFGVKSILWSRPEGDLDVSIMEIDGDTAIIPVVPWATYPLASEEKRVFIFGHAESGALSFSFGDNQFVGQNEQYVQYRSPTVGGSSGSPVFNSNWELIAVHHRGGYSLKRLDGDGVHYANQGSSVFAIRREIQKDPQQLFL